MAMDNRFLGPLHDRALVEGNDEVTGQDIGNTLTLPMDIISDSLSAPSLPDTLCPLSNGLSLQGFANPSGILATGEVAHQNLPSTGTIAPYLMPPTSGEQPDIRLAATLMYTNSLDGSITSTPVQAHGNSPLSQQYQPLPDQQLIRTPFRFLMQEQVQQLQLQPSQQQSQVQVVPQHHQQLAQEQPQYQQERNALRVTPGLQQHAESIQLVSMEYDIQHCIPHYIEVRYKTSTVPRTLNYLDQYLL